MKLESKHLCAYLPYSLKMSRNNFIGELITIKNSKETTAETFEFQVSCSNWWENTTDINHYKPILYPISMLTQEIEVNGEKFVPIGRIFNMSGNFQNGADYFGRTMVANLPYFIIEKLLEWHFDIYDLIPNNLAIDKTTLK